MQAPVHLNASTAGGLGCRDPETAPPSARAERRTRIVVGLTAAMMVAELVVGFATNSMALTADGFHMATHAGALGLAAAAYWYARTRRHAEHFSFGTGKVYALAGFTNAVVLGLVAVLMVAESLQRLVRPESVDYAESLPVAIVGLLVNLLSAVVLGHGHEHGQDHDHAHADGHDHAHEHAHEPDARGTLPAQPHRHVHHDHNLRAAYFHVLADALTSVLAIAALVGGWKMGWAFLDPAVGIVGGLVILHWGVGLCRDSARQLLDVVPSARLEQSIRQAIQREPEVSILDLHVWELGPGRCGCVVALAAPNPRDTAHYRRVILDAAHVAHLTVEVHEVAPAPLDAA